MAPIPDIRDVLTYFAAEITQFTIEYIGEIFGGVTPSAEQCKTGSTVMTVHIVIVYSTYV